MTDKTFLTEEYLEKLDAYLRAANYLSAAQLYLLENPLLREPLKKEHIKINTQFPAIGIFSAL